MPRRYSALIRTLAREADEAGRAEAKRRQALVLEEVRNYNQKWNGSSDWRNRKEALNTLFEYELPGSDEYLNRQLSERLYELANILQSSLCNKLVDDLPSLKRPQPSEADATDEIVEYHQQIDDFSKALEGGEADAISDYFELVLQCSFYPDGFHKNLEVVYANESRQLVADYQLPTIDEIVPAVEAYKRTRSGDIIEIKKKERARQQIYENAIASTVLRSINEIMQADRSRYVDVLTINGFVQTVDRGTGQQTRPYILSVRAIRDQFERLNLGQVDPSECLKRLTATVSRSAAELVPIKPIADINMFDPRFVQEQNIIAELDNRTNLMTLSPSEFESLITNLFQKMGLETKLTQPSRDGGVDCVAFDQRPILGGKVVVQAKHYKDTVGVGSARDLFGTMINEGASKGILVTMSGYGKASFEFANGKPIELIRGSNLLYLLREYAGVDAKIEPPEDWGDFQDGSPSRPLTPAS